LTSSKTNKYVLSVIMILTLLTISIVTFQIYIEKNHENSIKYQIIEVDDLSEDVRIEMKNYKARENYVFSYNGSTYAVLTPYNAEIVQFKSLKKIDNSSNKYLLSYNYFFVDETCKAELLIVKMKSDSVNIEFKEVDF